MSATQVHWLRFFESTINSIHKPFTVVLEASGCREGWLQGELFRAGRRYDLRVNEYPLGKRQTADLSCGDGPDMLAEIKIVGANYYAKMQGFIEMDVARMRAVSTPTTRRYMILVIPKSDRQTPLGHYLDSCSFSHTRLDRNWPGFRLRVWEL